MQSRVSQESPTLLNAFIQKLNQLENQTVWIAYDHSRQERKFFSSEEDLQLWLREGQPGSRAYT